MKNTIKAFACGTVATLAAIGLSHQVQGQNYVTESQTSTLAWSGTPVYQTGPTPESGSGGSTHDVSNWGTGGGVNGCGSVGQAFTVTSAGYLTSAQLVMAGNTGTFNVELYDVGSASSLGFPPIYSSETAVPSAMNQININASYGRPNLLSTGDSFTTTPMAGEELITLTFSGVDANVYLTTGEVYMLALDPTANVSRGSTWWSRDTYPVAAYDTGMAMNEDSASYAYAYQALGGRSTIRDLDTAVYVSATPPAVPYTVNLLGGFQGSSDATDVGWSDWTSGIPITNTAPAGDDQYSFPTVAVPGVAYSLQITPASGSYTQDLSLNMSSSQIAAFLTNSYLTFTFSAPAVNPASGGYLQLEPLTVNTPGTGFTTLPWSDAEETGSTANDSGGQPVFDYNPSGSQAVRSQTVTINYSSLLPAIGASPSYVQLVFTSAFGGGAPGYFYMNNVVLSTGPYGTTAPPPPPTLGIQVANPGLRMFAGLTSSGAREELATAAGYDVNWLGGNVQYSFTIIRDGAQTNYFQTQIFLIPINTIPTNTAQLGSPYNNNYVDYQASNLLWLQILGSNGSPTVTADVSWKINTPNANPTNVALRITNSTIVGTWTLAFTSPSNGTLTAPGASPTNFTIADAAATTDFAGPITAYFGVEANSSSAEGCYLDYSQISITGVAGNALVDNFPADTSLNTGLWTINPTAADTSIILVTASDPLWVTWSPTDAGYGLGVIPTLPATKPYGDAQADTNAFVLPAGYSGYSDNIITNIEGTTMWALIPGDCLPSNMYPNLTDAYFELFNPPPYW
jgi:hypothetical protein